MKKYLKLKVLLILALIICVACVSIYIKIIGLSQSKQVSEYTNISDAKEPLSESTLLIPKLIYSGQVDGKWELKRLWVDKDKLSILDNQGIITVTNDDVVLSDALNSPVSMETNAGYLNKSLGFGLENQLTYCEKNGLRVEGILEYHQAYYLVSQKGNQVFLSALGETKAFEGQLDFSDFCKKVRIHYDKYRDSLYGGFGL